MDTAAAIDTVWVVVAGCLVLFMQAGFAMLEVGFSRMKNAGAVMAKVLINLCFAIVAFWAIGYAIAFGDGSGFIGATGWFIELGNPDGVPSLAYSAVDENTKWFFEATFAAVALAIVWGSMLDRVRFGAYLPFAAIFVGVIYPIVVHWQWGGGGCTRTASRTSPAPGSSTCAARRPPWRAPSSWGRVSASSARTAGRCRYPATRCRSPSSGC